MKFDPENPLPDIDSERIDYEFIKGHAAQMDQWLGYKLDEVEAKVRDRAVAEEGREYWTEKPVQTFSTPYLDVQFALKSAGTKECDVVADLGCGYGRVGAVIALRFPGTGFVGVEMIPERCEEAARVLEQFSNLPRALHQKDLRFFNVADARVDSREATIFFIYDFGSREDFKFVFDSLRALASKREITVIARGGRSRDLIQKTERWLCEVNPPQHFKRFSIYRS
jgi:SAM-dependent methyltransferase